LPIETVANLPAAIVTVILVATLSGVVPGDGTTKAGNAGSGTSAVTEPCMVPGLSAK
jgi:hypothetical protein